MNLDQFFKFDIGQAVYFKTAHHDYHHTPNAFTITHRRIEQNDGGKTVHYYLDAVDHWVPEIALTKTLPEYKHLQDYKLMDRARLASADRRLNETDITKLREVFGKKETQKESEE